MKRLLASLLLVAFSGASMAAEHWYRVEVDKCSGTCTFYGGSPLSPSEFKEALLKEPFIKLTNLFYIEKDKFKSWSDWDDKVIPEITIRSSAIVLFMEYKKGPFEK